MLNSYMGTVIQLHTLGFRGRLREAHRHAKLVRLWRGALELGSFCGYVVGLGREFFLLSVIGDSISFDGVYAMRYRDITELETPEQHHRFIEKALAVHKIVPLRPEPFPLDHIREALAAAAAYSPAIGVHVDSEDDTEVCYIGRLLNLDDDGFNLQEISPDAEWLRDPSWFAWDEVSTISFEEPYCRALLEVAGPAPDLASLGPDFSLAH